MALSLGKKDFSPVKDFAELSGDMTAVNSTLFFSEGKILKLDNGYAFCVVATKIDDLKKADTFTPGTLVCWVAHSKEYELYKYPEGKQPVQPTELEKTVIYWLEEGDGKQWLEKTFKGKLHLNGSPAILGTIKQKNLWDILAEFSETESNVIKDLIPKSGGNGYKKASQSQFEQLTEREKYLIATAKPYSEGAEHLVALAISLVSMKQDVPEAYEIFMQLAKLTLGE